jgi:hypothetical protein
MSRVCVSARTGAAIYVFAADHCPPHIHARHRGEGWTARVRFSFVTNEVELVSVTPLRNAPLPRAIGELLDDVRSELPACRRTWWTMQNSVCLANRWALEDPQAVTVLTERRPKAVQIEDADYDPQSGRLRIVFRDATALVIEAGSGRES